MLPQACPSHTQSLMMPYFSDTRVPRVTGATLAARAMGGSTLAAATAAASATAAAVAAPGVAEAAGPLVAAALARRRVLVAAAPLIAATADAAVADSRRRPLRPHRARRPRPGRCVEPLPLRRAALGGCRCCSHRRRCAAPSPPSLLLPSLLLPSLLLSSVRGRRGCCGAATCGLRLSECALRTHAAVSAVSHL